MKLLLHACCAPCANQCVASLLGEGLSPTLFWYNPNIHPYTEYTNRLDSLRTFADTQGAALIEDGTYGLRSFLEMVGSRYDTRCLPCYGMRLERTAAYAAAHGYDGFSTTLLISPYQQHDALRALGEEAATRHGIAFVYRDFRPLFRPGQQFARQAEYYMQKYCGCIFSEEDRYMKRSTPRGINTTEHRP